MWMDLEERGDIDPNRHWHMRSDQWMEECLGYPDSQISEEFHIKVKKGGERERAHTNNASSNQ
jgi:hypothetical protein